jgi:hypothetical protein
MMILPQGHAQTISQRRALRPREKWMLGGVLTGLAVLVVAVVIALATQGHKSAHGCVSVALAYSTGGAQIDRCGASARALCAGAGRTGGITGETGKTVANACRKAGLPVG